MDSPSSTSSSEQVPPTRPTLAALPWAGLFAIAILAFADLTLYRTESIWQAFDQRLTGSNLLEQGLVQDRIQLASLDARDGRPEVFIIGSSRLNRGYRPETLAPGSEPDAQIVKLAHPQFFPFEMRAAIDEVLRHEPRVVLFALGEFETHTRIKFVPGSSFGNLSAIRELAREAGWGFVSERRVMLARIALGDLINSYHYRALVGRMGVSNLHRFKREPRLKVRDHPERSLSFLAGERKEISFEELSAIVAEFDARFPGRGSIIRKAQFGLLRSITPGQHAEINLALMRSIVDKLRKAGVSVVLVEPPIYPDARSLYADAAREEFLVFASELERDHDVTFVALEEGPVYVPADFADLTHLERSGAEKFSEVVAAAIRQALRRDPRGDASQ